MDEDQGREDPSSEGMVVVFRAATYREAIETAGALADHGLDSTPAREAGFGFTELTEHLAFEEMPSFVVVVPEEQAENARLLLEQLGLVGMMPPAHMAMAQKPWVRRSGGAIALGFVAFMVIWCLLALLVLMGVIDF